MFIEPITELHWAYQLHYSIFFRTRKRRVTFDAERKTSLSRLLKEVCEAHNYHLLEHKVYPDHLRCLLSLRPDQAISSVVNKIKSNSSRELRLEFNLETPLWATGYLANSIGRVRIQAVKQYLANQSEHHGYASRLRPPVFRYRCERQTTLRAAHSVFALNYHLVLATHYRRGIFGSTLGRALVEYWLRVAAKREFAFDQATVLPDHVHLLVRLLPRMSIEQCALSLMNNSEDWIAKQHSSELVQAGAAMLWQRSAYAGTCGEVTTAMVKAFLGAGDV